MSALDLPVRHEFYDAGDPQHPILLPGGVEITVTETTVERRYLGLETEEIVIRFYVNLA